MTGGDAAAAVRTVLAPLPGAGGGVAVVLATSGSPPAMALLSSGDVAIDGATVRAVTYGSGSAVERLGGAFTLLVPAAEVAYRVEVVDASARRVGGLAVLEGTLAAIRPTAEPPWVLDLRFRPGADAPPADVARFVAYWAGVRRWLAGGAVGDPPPAPPATA